MMVSRHVRMAHDLARHMVVDGHIIGAMPAPTPARHVLGVKTAITRQEQPY
jgi:hypothetical protein